MWCAHGGLPWTLDPSWTPLAADVSPPTSCVQSSKYLNNLFDTKAYILINEFPIP